MKNTFQIVRAEKITFFFIGSNDLQAEKPGSWDAAFRTAHGGEVVHHCFFGRTGHFHNEGPFALMLDQETGFHHLRDSLAHSDAAQLVLIAELLFRGDPRSGRQPPARGRSISTRSGIMPD